MRRRFEADSESVDLHETELPVCLHALSFAE